MVLRQLAVLTAFVAASAGAADVTLDVAKAKSAEAAMVQALPRTAFFETAPGDLQGAPGTLIRTESFVGYAVPPGARATRIIYRSRSQLDEPTIASAVLVVPPGEPPAGGWPMLVWAHGTTGVARQCAPSLSKEIGYYMDVLAAEGAKRNFAVLSVDYSGLGAGKVHEYLWKDANANDVAFAAPAAQAAESRLAPAWVAIGHSQGGQAVWGVAEKMTALKDPTYRGSVALAPAVDTKQLIEHTSSTQDETFYAVFVAYGIKSVFSDFDVKTMLQPTGADAYPTLSAEGCWPLAYFLFKPVVPGTVLRAEWGDNPDTKRFFASNQVGEKTISGPLFVASGLTDTAVPPEIISARVRSLCRLGAENVTYKEFAGDHGTMMQSSFGDQMQWIVDRFSGRPTEDSCPNLKAGGGTAQGHL